MARREFNVFNLSFLDIISCGFGAVILFFMIISTQPKTKSERASKELYAQSQLIDERIFDEKKNQVVLRNSLNQTIEESQIVEGSISDLIEQIQELEIEISNFNNTTVASTDNVNQIKADIKQIIEDNKRLQTQIENTQNNSTRSFEGDGGRQYLTGLRMSGEHVLFLVDASTSMLGRTVTNAIRFGTFSDEMKIRAPKWRHVLRGIDWLSTQLEPGTKFQIYVFNEDAQTAIVGSNGGWIEVIDGSEIESAIKDLRRIVPDKGTNLTNAFEALLKLDPYPDNIFLFTDGLPTQGNRIFQRKTFRVSQDDRMKFFEEAGIAFIPTSINVLLYPIDGDPEAALKYWEFVRINGKGGGLMTVASDWP